MNELHSTIEIEPLDGMQVKTECGMLCWSEDIDVPSESVWEDVSRSIG